MEIGVHANALTSEEDGAANEVLHRIRVNLSADPYATFVCSWAAAGAMLIGGCCGAGASQIHNLLNRLKQNEWWFCLRRGVVLQELSSRSFQGSEGKSDDIA